MEKTMKWIWMMLMLVASVSEAAWSNVAPGGATTVPGPYITAWQAHVAARGTNAHGGLIATNQVDGTTIIYSNGVLQAIAPASPDVIGRANLATHTNAPISTAHTGVLSNAQLPANVLTNGALYATAAQGARADLAITQLTVSAIGAAGGLTNAAAFDVAGAALAASNALNSRVDGTTNGAALGVTALQPASTNGAEWGSHAALYPSSNPSGYVNAASATGIASAVASAGYYPLAQGQAASNLAAGAIQSSGGNAANLTNFPASVVRTNATDVTFSGWRFYNIGPASRMQSLCWNGELKDTNGVDVLTWNDLERNAESINGTIVATWADVFRVGPDSGTNVAVYASITNLDAQVATKLATNGPASGLSGCPSGAVSNSAAAMAAAGGVTNGGATVNGFAISNGAAIRTYSAAPTVITATYPTQYLSIANGGWQYLAPTGAVTLAFSNDWPAANSSILSLSLFSASAVSVDPATVSTSMWAACSISTAQTNLIVFARGYGMPRFVPAASTNWLNP